MAKEPDTIVELHRLQAALEYSYDKLEPFRRRRRTAIEQYVGAHYGDSNSREKVPMNLISLAVNTWTRQLVARNPAVTVRTPVRRFQPLAYTFELSMRKAFELMGLKNALRVWLQEALLSPMGILKVGRCMSENRTAQGHYYGEPYADPIDFDDWVQDMGASCWDTQQFRGNIYRMTVEEVRRHPLFNRERTEAKADEEAIILPSGDERILGLTTGGETPRERLYDTCTLLDLYLPYERKMLTLLGRIGDRLRILRVDPYPIPRGPYHQLAFDNVPGNPVPRPPVSELIDLHNLANTLFLKLEDQAKRQKTVMGVQAPAKDDAERIVEAADGEIILMVNPDAMRQYSFSGIDQPTLAFALLLKDLFSYFGGNLDLMAGLGNQSPTLGQDQLLNASASRRLSDMGDVVHDAVRRVCKDIGFWLWTDGDRVDYVEKVLPGMENIYATVRLGPEERSAASYENFEFDIEPYSMQHKTPQGRIATVTHVLQTLSPFMGLLQQQGKTLNAAALLEMLARDTNIEELRELFMEADPNLDGTLPEPEEVVRKAPVTNRTYTRINKSDRSPNSAAYAIAQTLLGGQPQQAEAMNAGRVS